jgi:hypothetical protein
MFAFRWTGGCSETVERHAESITRQTGIRTRNEATASNLFELKNIQRIVAHLLTVKDRFNENSAEGPQHFGRPVEIEVSVAGRYMQKEGVVACRGKSLRIEKWIVRTGKSVQREHTQDSAERSEEYCKFKDDRD